jgi:two-component system LytT family response regulator
MSASPISALIVDDEHHARDRLRVLLGGDPDIEVVGECENGLEALAAITRMRPELVFLDVQMPDVDGLGVITALGEDETPEIIFVTAHDAYMEQAFEVHAVDYLRKPYTNARFASALARARWLIHARRSHRRSDGPSPAESTPQRSRYSPMLASVQAYRSDTRIALRDCSTGVWHLVDQQDIDWIEGDGSARVRVHVGAEAYVWRRTLSDLEHTLDPRLFLRIHRSYIVNTGRIKHVKPLQRGEYTVFLGESTMFDTGRTYHGAIERFLEARA